MDKNRPDDQPLPPKRTCEWCKIDYWLEPGEIHGCVDGGKAQRAALAAAYALKVLKMTGK
jgi:hypothetical protein